MESMDYPMLKCVRTCSKCGSRFLLQGYDTDIELVKLMDEECACFECVYWEDKIQYPIENAEVLDNCLIQVNPMVLEKRGNMVLGSKGKTRYFLKADHSVLASNDVWTIGLVPERFRRYFPNTVCEINRRAYKGLSKINKKCTARFCQDRYFCYRYDRSIETEDNIIPIHKTWKLGDEHCNDFIAFEDILTDENNLYQNTQ